MDREFGAKEAAGFVKNIDFAPSARAFDAACTPDPYLFDASLRLVYRGRIDDNWKRPEAVTRHELRAAVLATLAGQAPASPQHPSLGCGIKWRAG